MAVKVIMAKADGEVREFDVDSGGRIAVEPGDAVTLPEIELAKATIEMIDGDDVALTSGDQMVVLTGFYGCLDAEHDVALNFADSSAEGTIDTLGTLLIRTSSPVEGETQALPGVEDDLLFFSAEGAVADEAAAEDAGAWEDQEVLFVDVEGIAEPIADAGYLSDTVLSLGDLLDLGDGRHEIAIDPVVMATGLHEEPDEMEGYFGVMELADGQLYGSTLATDLGVLADAPAEAAENWLYSSQTAPGHDSWIHFTGVESTLLELQVDAGDYVLLG